MEMYNGSEQMVIETYMMPGTGPDALLTSTPPLEEADYAGTEVAPEFIFDQGLYYPAAANYYGYYCTGFEPPGEWDDHHRFFASDGQDLDSGLQSESSPIVYYPPTYGYAQSPYNPYNPYIPGAVMGHDAPYVGSQQYFTPSAYQQALSSPAYIPVILQPTSEAVPNTIADPSFSSNVAGVVGRPNSTGIKYATPVASGNSAASSLRIAPGSQSVLPQPSPYQTQTISKLSEGSAFPAGQNKAPLIQSSMPPRTIPQIKTSGSIQTANPFTRGRDFSAQNTIKKVLPTSNGLTNFGSNTRDWATWDKFGPRYQFNGVLNNGSRGPDATFDQNRGPRTSRSKSQSTSVITVKAYTTKAGIGDAQGNIVINTDQYNREEFPVDYPSARFFVIKSYSEDDVHKSIKYNVWSSTTSGNKRLDTAYEEARRMSVGKPRNCPVFLFFSVNASGQFCGVAEMVGPVNFSHDMNFWQQDKWTGSFPVKWHIVKDVPNGSFRHIILENNENRPVTNSRDTQEITYLPGISMLHIFKNSPLRTSILDDFMFYEERQRIMEEEKARRVGRNHEASFNIPSFVPSSRINPISDQPLRGDEKLTSAVDLSLPADGKQQSGSLDQIVKENGLDNGVGLEQQPVMEQANLLADQPPEGNIKQMHEVVNLLPQDQKQQNGSASGYLKANMKHLNGMSDQSSKAVENPTKTSVKASVGAKADATTPLNAINDIKPDHLGASDLVKSAMKLGSLSIDSKMGEAAVLGPESKVSPLTDGVTVGSVYIKVNKGGQSSSTMMGVGSLPAELKERKPNKDGKI